jgi:hypothetical protein
MPPRGPGKTAREAARRAQPLTVPTPGMIGSMMLM